VNDWTINTASGFGLLSLHESLSTECCLFRSHAGYMMWSVGTRKKFSISLLKCKLVNYKKTGSIINDDKKGTNLRGLPERGGALVTLRLTFIFSFFSPYCFK